MSVAPPIISSAELPPTVLAGRTPLCSSSAMVREARSWSLLGGAFVWTSEHPPTACVTLVGP